MGILSWIFKKEKTERVHTLVDITITGIIDGKRIVLSQGSVPIEEWAKTKNDMVDYWQAVARSVEYNARISGYYTDSGFYAEA